MASPPQLPELDYEAMPAEEILGDVPRRLPRPRLARLLLPEGGVGAARHAARARPEGARLRARHARALPRDLRRLARGRAPLRHEGRGLRGPVARTAGRGARRRAVEEQPDALLLDPQGRAARRARSPTSTAGSPACAATSRRRARTRRRSAGTRPRALEGEPARRLGRRALLGLHPRARPALQPAARPRLLLDRLHALHAAGRRAARAAGPAREDRVRPARRRCSAGERA